MKTIYTLHKWTSIVCAIFLLLLILTGLPLLFRGEINGWNTTNQPKASGPMAVEDIWKSLGEGEAAVRAAYPGKEIVSVSADGEDGTLYFLVQDAGSRGKRAHMRMGGEQIMYDVREGWLFDRAERAYRSEGVRDFMHTMHLLHVQLGGTPHGRDILVIACILSLLSLVTGLYLYGPMMRRLALGVLRRDTRRLYWSDWHKSLSLLAATWALVLVVSGIGIDTYSRGAAAYRTAAQAEAVEAFGASSASPQLTMEQALARAQESYPEKEILSIAGPTKDLAAYKVELGDTPAKPSNFSLGEALYVGAADGALRLVPAPAWLAITPFFINIHIHNHDLFLERILWAALILLAAAMVVTGALLYVAKPRPMAGVRTPPVARSFPVQGELALLLLLPMVALLLPIYGGWGDAGGLIAFAAMLFAGLRLWRRG